MPWQMLILLFLPFVVMAGIIVEVFMFGASHPNAIEMDPDSLYCHLGINTPGSISVVLSVIPLAGSIVMMGITAVTLYRHWSEIQSGKLNNSSNTVSLSTIIRLGAFVMFPMLGLGIALAFPGSSTSSVNWNMVLPIIPLSAALIFGTQKDLMAVYACGKSRSYACG